MQHGGKAFSAVAHLKINSESFRAVLQGDLGSEYRYLLPRIVFMSALPSSTFLNGDRPQKLRSRQELFQNNSTCCLFFEEGPSLQKDNPDVGCVGLQCAIQGPTLAIRWICLRFTPACAEFGCTIRHNDATAINSRREPPFPHCCIVGSEACFAQ